MAFLKETPADLERVASWWYQLAVEKEDGIVVLSWLYALGQVSFDTYSLVFAVADAAEKVQESVNSPTLERLVEELKKHVPRDMDNVTSMIKNMYNCK